MPPTVSTSNYFVFYPPTIISLNQLLNANIVLINLLIVCDSPALTVTTDRDELILFLKQMYTMRRMEITNDTEYKVGHRDYLAHQSS